MKPNPILPILAKIAPPLFLAALAGFAIKEIFSATDKKPKIESAHKAPEQRKPVFSSVPAEGKCAIPPNSAGKIRSETVLSAIVPASAKIPLASEIAAEEIKITENKRNLITREHMKIVFNCGKTRLSRKDATEFLKKLGFGKSAAYKALLSSGRFSAWLQIEPDGMITWADR